MFNCILFHQYTIEPSLYLYYNAPLGWLIDQMTERGDGNFVATIEGATVPSSSGVSTYCACVCVPRACAVRHPNWRTMDWGDPDALIHHAPNTSASPLTTMMDPMSSPMPDLPRYPWQPSARFWAGIALPLPPSSPRRLVTNHVERTLSLN